MDEEKRTKRIEIKKILRYNKKKQKREEKMKKILQKQKIESENGSASSLVLFTVLLFGVILMGTYMLIMTMQKSQLKSDIRIQEIYQEEIEKTEQVYQKFIKSEFNYTGNVQEYTIPVTGKYLLEVYGAQGGDVTSHVDVCNMDMTYKGGQGGYSKGIAYLEKGQKLYIYIGGEGIGATKTGESLQGGYNGGGSVTGSSSVNHITASGGGATHIATKEGLLSTLADSIDNILIVAGGGGGARNQANHVYSKGARWGHGGSGGGLSGGSSILYEYDMDTNFTDESDKPFIEDASTAGTQTSGYAFGLGESGKGNSAGGGGFYGGRSNKIRRWRLWIYRKIRRCYY